ncbi:MAG TPA: class IV adenylate cyclase [Terriglobales bacterium]|nr:class IV adenylate cyclase [Terriglobales bacterium]
MPSSNPKEIEIKFRLEDVASLGRKLRRAGFRLTTRRTHEQNTLYDLEGSPLRQRGEILRLRKYGSDWELTHKSKGKNNAGKHKTRIENQTKVADGPQMEAIILALGYKSLFRYEKFRATWSDGQGVVVLDETPIGNFGEIEGPARWIDRTARLLGIAPSGYITKSYGELFLEWKEQHQSPAEHMTFRDIR